MSVAVIIGYVLSYKNLMLRGTFRLIRIGRIMDIARCTENGLVYTAATFATLHPNDLERMRQQLTCPECSGPAFYRKASISGRAACFGARPHHDACSLAAQDSEHVIEGEGTDLDVLNNPAERIVVDLAFGAPAREVHGDLEEGAGRAGRAPRYVGGNPRPNARMHRRLSSLLRTLIEAPHFARSNQLLEIAGQPEISVCDFFVPLTQVDKLMQGRIRGWWGLISDAKVGGDESLWLNGGGRGMLSCCIPYELRTQVLGRFRLDDIEQLAGAYVLVIGDLRISQHGKMYCVIDSPNHIAIRLT